WDVGASRRVGRGAVETNGRPPSSSLSAVLKNVLSVGKPAMEWVMHPRSKSTHPTPAWLAATPTPSPHGPAPIPAISCSCVNSDPPQKVRAATHPHGARGRAPGPVG